MADRRLAELIRNLDARLASEHELVDAGASGTVPAATTLTVSAAVERFLKTHGEIGPDETYRGDSERGTWKKYRCALRLLVAF